MTALMETPDCSLFPGVENIHRHLHVVGKTLPQNVSVLWLLRDPPTKLKAEAKLKTLVSWFCGIFKFCKFVWSLYIPVKGFVILY